MLQRLTLLYLTLFSLSILPLFAQQATKHPETELMIWTKADDLLTFFKDGERINRWPDASGNKNDLIADGDRRPSLTTEGIGGHAAVLFQGDTRVDPKINHAFDMPLTGEWRGVTVFVLGTNMAGGGILDTAPGSSGCLRTCGWMQLTSSKIGFDQPFPAITNSAVPALITITGGINEKGGLQLFTFANGQKQRESKDDDPLYSIIFRNSRIGNNNGGEGVFNGKISELLIYRGMLSEKDRQQTEQYLLAKYKIAGAKPDAAKLPAGFIPPLDPEAKPLPVVKASPSTTELALRISAEDLFGKGLKAGSPIDELPNHAGNGVPVTSSDLLRPKYQPAAINNRPVLKFEGNGNANPKVLQYLKIPIEGEYPEVSFCFAGKNLNRAGVIDTAPGQNHCFRTMGWLQLTGSKIAPGNPYPLLSIEPNAPQMITIIIGKLGEKGQYIETYANGHLQTRNEDPDNLIPVLFRNATIGTNNLGETQFNGEIAEALIYTHALTEKERIATEAYLSEKWNIPIRTPAEIAALQNARSYWTTRANQLPRTFSWFGNSFSGKTEWVQSGISGITALPDGTVIATSIWDEPHKEIGFYKDGKPIGPVIHGGACKITFNEQYMYVGLSGMGKPQAGIRRLTLEGEESPWKELGEAKWPTFPTPAIWNEVQGIAITDTEIFVTATGVNEIRVYDITSATFKRSLPVTAPGALLIDKAGLIWLGNSNGVTQYLQDGKPTGKQLNGFNVGAMAFDPQGRLVIADAGERQQLIYLDINGAQPREVTALLQRGGVWAKENYSRITDDRIINPNGLGIDAQGNLYVNGTGILSSYTPKGELRWRIFSTVFCTCSDFDAATNGADIYAGLFHYQHKPNEVAGKDWQLAAVTHDTKRFPEMSGSMSQSNILRRINGRLYRFAIGIGVYIQQKEENSSIFVPAACYTGQGNKGGQFRPKAAPDKGRFSWSDLNGNGLIEKEEISLPPTDVFEMSHEFYSYGIDEKGGICEPLGRFGVRYTPLKDFTLSGAPTYKMENQVVYKRPAEFCEILRSYYYSNTDTMYLAGFTWDFPANGKEQWGNCGREVIVYNNWSNLEKRTVRTRIPYPDGVDNVKAISILNTANLLFVGQMESSVIFIYNTINGKLLGIVEPDPEIVGGVGWIDIGEGIRAFQEKNGDYLLLVEDSWAQKEMVYRIPASINKDK